MSRVPDFQGFSNTEGLSFYYIKLNIPRFLAFLASIGREVGLARSLSANYSGKFIRAQDLIGRRTRCVSLSSRKDQIRLQHSSSLWFFFPMERDRDSGSFSFRLEQVDLELPRCSEGSCLGSVKWTGEIDGAGYTRGRKYLRSAFVKSRGSFCPPYEESVCLRVITSVLSPATPVGRSTDPIRFDRAIDRTTGENLEKRPRCARRVEKVSLATLLTSIDT